MVHVPKPSDHRSKVGVDDAASGWDNPELLTDERTPEIPRGSKGRDRRAVPASGEGADEVIEFKNLGFIFKEVVIPPRFKK